VKTKTLTGSHLIKTLVCFVDDFEKGEVNRQKCALKRRKKSEMNIKVNKSRNVIEVGDFYQTLERNSIREGERTVDCGGGKDGGATREWK